MCGRMAGIGVQWLTASAILKERRTVVAEVAALAAREGFWSGAGEDGGNNSRDHPPGCVQYEGAARPAGIAFDARAARDWVPSQRPVRRSLKR